MISRLARSVTLLLTLIVACLSLQLVGATSANAATCQMVGSGLSRHQYCSGIQFEYLGSKFYKGESNYFDGTTQNVDASIDMTGLLLDKSADGDCAWVRVKAVNAHWPDGNFATKDAWKVCGKGTEKIVGIDLSGAWTYAGTAVSIQHCQETGAQRVCTTFWKRTIPE